MAIAELKADIGYQIARNVGSKFEPKVNLQSIRGITIEDARSKKQESEDFQERVNYFFSVIVTSNSPEIRAEAQNSVAEELTNLGALSQAEDVLYGKVGGVLDDPISRLEGSERQIQEASRFNRRAWIEDSRTGFGREIDYIRQARLWLDAMQPGARDQRFYDLESTLDHFTGRALLGRASQGIDKEANLSWSIQYFNKDLQRYLQFRKEDNPRPVGEGFGHVWLARVELLRDNWEHAEEEIDIADELFLEATNGNSENEVMAHSYVLKGYFCLKDRRQYGPNLDQAEHCFSLAARIRGKTHNYPKGEADAHMGLYQVYKAKWDITKAVHHFRRAFNIFPYSVFNPILGG